MQQTSNSKKKTNSKEKNNMVYTVTKIFGVDAVKTRVFSSKEKAKEDINENIAMLLDEVTEIEVIEKENEETYYIVNRSDDPTEFIEFILRRNEIR